MQIETLNLFCDIVRLQNFTQAAKGNGVSQSRASQALNMLERTFGVQLLDRTQRPWKLTKEGQILYEEGLEIVSRYNDAMHRINDLDSSSVICLGAIYSVAIRHMRLYIRRYAEHKPTTKIKLDYLSPDAIVNGVLENEIDIGIVSFPEEHKRLEILPWQDELMVLACSPEHPLAVKSEIKVRDIYSERMIMFDQTLRIRKEVDKFLAENGVTDPIVELEFDNIESMKKAVEEGSGVSIIPRPTFEREIRRGTLCAVHFDCEDFCRPLCIVARKGHDKLPHIRKFIQFLKYGNPV